ncbi:tRNA (cytosine-5-)-methyltransferase, putative [Entamoeba histolytica HM-1:IMSS-B]|uniref:tRNA (Cytosine-5-)-methyltransferase, putative n=6 Tax=Entamoeba histolytica TaxID=5759 RepID=C4LXD0_ENTH1|nr:tRNA (cytosine-5-)-methyltransferase, putative [Entamoeba histolytica HM-1:IMSS]EMD48446.1 tRNA (cytosine5)-methyltransferase, putative [Entamoeba histolytica KU27]EMH73313.1 tRNA (cytosine-5-)-methyltransferase, putative [Entamoeba histolytica HM-1:IMSS-B]EMS13673.1 tRNA (cytosine-5-)-methyltransferase [Entamoeba histolytica HM-3:IMSS]ENY65830.1 tRNA (cytosine-5-)-methyltransferase, putative [Entamoeba histolytica HM-1:IMSS-A]GAT93407.1 tRNA cytosine 5 methyltransferase putative [Entamoeba|eukprot:XP_656026.1 tRNA (cytosine-5-)-methyltransferase, putative [Entamoeba histolytica HM-1:IMSS]
MQHPQRFNKYEQTSPYYEKYYKLQGIINPEEEEQFMKVIKTPLPTSFRLTKSSETFPKVHEVVNKIISEIPEEYRPHTFEWCPNTYQLEVERKQIRKCEQYNTLHKFMILMNESGEISRQEVVSMLPAILLDVHEGSSVLDICAAPGSKTSQLVEMVGPTGCVVANDVDKQRSYLLTHQTKRLSAPHIVITNYRAQELSFNGFQFDRMLCDVPCTGDGTIRKNVDARTKWHVMNAYTLHREQLDIMKHVLCHVKVGGKFVYSTCSLNPIEDEAVVAELLRTFGDSIELIDARPLLPTLKFSEGVSEWKVFDKHFTVMKDKNDNIPITAFPPKPEEAAKFHLEYTLRILPHQQNTGGFFTAVFIKKGETPAPPPKQKKEKKYVGDNGEEVIEKQPTKRRRGMAPLDEQELKPLLSTPEGEKLFESIKNFYNLSDSFPKDQLYVVGEDCLTIHYLSKTSTLLAHDIKVISGGVKMFKRHKSELVGAYRIVSEGVVTLGEYIGQDRCIEVSHEMFMKLLREDVLLSEFKKEFKGNGCYLVKVVDGILQGNYYCGWVGRVYLSMLINKQDLDALRFLFNIIAPEKKLHREIDDCLDDDQKLKKEENKEN